MSKFVIALVVSLAVGCGPKNKAPVAPKPAAPNAAGPDAGAPDALPANPCAAPPANPCGDKKP